MADRKISDLTALTTPATGDLLPIVDVSEAAAADKNKSITVGELLRGAPDGTAAAPGIAFESDGGNGMFLGGTDILAFSTGGTQAVTIDASQRLGVGTSSPTHTLEVAGKIAVTGTESALGNSSIPTIYRSGSDSGSYPFNNFGHLVVQPRCDGANRDIVFATGTSGANKVVIDSSGRLGVGTTSPNRQLVVNGGASEGVIQITNNTSGTAAANGFELIHFTNGETQLLNRENGAMRFDTNNSEAMRIDSSGRVGIGTSSPDTNLVVKGATGDAAIKILAHNTFSQSRIQFADSTAVDGVITYDHNSRKLHIGAGTSTATDGDIVINSSGNVGIGTTSPTNDLSFGANFARITSDTSDGSDTKVIAIGGGGHTATTRGAYTELYGNEHSSLPGYCIITSGNVANSPLILQSRAAHVEFRSGGSTEKARIDSSGRLLVGTSSAISGSGANDNLQLVNSAGSILSVASSDTTISSGTRIGEIEFWGQPGSTWGNFATIGCFGDATAASGDNPGRLVFSVTADGQSSPTERMRIYNSGTARHLAASDTLNARSGASPGTSNSLFWGTHSATAIDSTGTNCFYVRTNGDVQNTNNSYGAISDINLKENIVNANSQWSDIKALQVRKYNFRPETGHQTHTQLGLIAQEAELVSPGLVSESPDIDEDGNDLGTTTKSVNYSVLYMKAVKALQEAMERIETLEQRLNDAGIN